MASTNFPLSIKFKPGQALGFVLSAAIVLGFFIVAAQLLPDEWDWLYLLRPDPTNRVTFFVGYGAFVAALWGARIAVINVIRQHTINTLLQSRLSEIFIEKGARVNSSLEEYKKDCSTRGAQYVTKSDYFKNDDLKYILNFYEYIAVGLKNGDLDEDLLYDALRSVVLNLCENFRDYINTRQSHNPRLYCNLTNLEERWRNEEKKSGFRADEIKLGHCCWVIAAFLAVYTLISWVPNSLSKTAAKANGYNITESEAYEKCAILFKEKSISPTSFKIRKIDPVVFAENIYVFKWKHGDVISANDSGALVAFTASCEVSAITGDVTEHQWVMRKNSN
ncbi:DUF4760 domain-containing protein [Delftia tsuruhatensis]